MPYCRNEQRFASLLPTPSFFVKSLWLCMKGFYSLVLFQVNFFNSLISNISILNIFPFLKVFFSNFSNASPITFFSKSYFFSKMPILSKLMFSSSKKDLKNALAEFLAEPEGPTKKFQIFIYLIHFSVGGDCYLFIGFVLLFFL